MYTKFYGFSEKPFELTPDPKFLYLTAGHREALTSMISGIQEQRGLICITGEVGTGKTTLIHLVLGNLGEKVKTVFIFHPTVNFKDLLENICLDLAVKVRGKSKESHLYQLVEYSNECITRKEILAIIIDEAQNLPEEVIEELGVLCNPEVQTLKRFQIVLVGQPELQEKLASEKLRQFKQGIEIKRQISALGEKESKEYIDHRLRLVGSSSSDVFTLGAISMICRHAKGIPRVMNVLCDNAFLKGYGLSRKKIDVDIIREVIKEIEGPSQQRITLSSISTAIRKLRLPPLRPSLFLNRASLAILSLLCVGVLTLLGYGYLQRRQATTRNINNLKSGQEDIEHPSRLPSPLTVTEEGSKSDARPHGSEPKPVSPELLQPVSRPADSRIRTIGENKLKKVVDVEAGQTISYLARKYFGMANSTLVDLILDFNPGITNVHLITVNQRIKIPIITEESLILQSPDRAYRIHAGTFLDPDIVRAYREEPALKGKEIEILPRKVSPQETWYRVVIGKFDSEEEALEVIDLLKKRGLLPSFGGDPRVR